MQFPLSKYIKKWNDLFQFEVVSSPMITTLLPFLPSLLVPANLVVVMKISPKKLV